MRIAPSRGATPGREPVRSIAAQGGRARSCAPACSSFRLPYSPSLEETRLLIRAPLSDRDRRIEPDSDDGSGRQVDVLAVGGRNRAARADHCAEHGALDAADQPANHAADTCAGARGSDLLTNAPA